jgi:hypothetical protein
VRDRRRKTVAIDFDGVLNPVVDGCEDALRSLAARFRLVVFTARYDHALVLAYLIENKLDRFFSDITREKGRFDLIVDDLPLCHFTGDWEAVLRAAAQLER